MWASRTFFARPSSSGAEVYGLVGEIDDEPDAIPEKVAAREAAGPLAALLGDAATRDPLLKLIVVWGCVSMSYYGLTFCAGSLSDRVVANFVLLNAADVPGYALAGYATKRTGAPERILVGFAGAAGVDINSRATLPSARSRSARRRAECEVAYDLYPYQRLLLFGL